MSGECNAVTLAQLSLRWRSGAMIPGWRLRASDAPERGDPSQFGIARDPLKTPRYEKDCDSYKEYKDPRRSGELCFHV